MFGKFVIKRLLFAIPLLLVMSLVAFFIIQAPPGDFITAYTAALMESGDQLDYQQLEALRERYGLDQPVIVQYFKWIAGVLHGDFGLSFQWRTPVSTLIWERMGLSVILSIATVLLTWIIAIPIGIYSSVRKNSIGDYIATFVGFLGLAIPSFLLALLLMYLSVVEFGFDASGLFSMEFRNAPWSFARFADLLKHLWVPVIILGVNSTASIIRVMRANLLDELPKLYVVTARAKGLSEFKLLMKYPVRVALNPIVSTIGWLFPQIISGSIIVSFVMGLPTAGPLLLESLKSQDMYLAGSLVLLLGCLSIIGMLISDILLALIDPRIRYQ